MYDYFIVGQGISGSFLSYYLMQAGKKVLVIDEANPFTASKVASGVINPVTGRRIVKTWLIDELLPFCQNEYTSLGNLVGKTLLRQCNVLDLYATQQMKEAFEKRQLEEPGLLHPPDNEEHWQQYFRYNYGIGEIDPCLLADMSALLDGWRDYLLQNNSLLEEKFDWASCRVSANEIQYKGMVAGKLICCEGVGGTTNPYFNLLPYAVNKGEALIAHIPNLPQTNIYKQGISIVPLAERDMFWIGSTYEWKYENVQPTEAFKQRTMAQLDYLLKMPYTITNQVAAERPANVERRPFVGLHPVFENVGVLNGMGTKGCSLAPYFAWQLKEYLVNNKPIEPLADVRRFSRVLSRGF